MKERRIIDISLPLRDSMRGFRKSVARTMEEDGWNASTLEIYSHAGTHMDAPLHFNVNMTSIDKFPVERLVCPCHIIRLSPVKPKLLITEESLGEATAKAKPGDGIIFHTGWSQYVNDSSSYRDQLPRISTSLARWMVSRGINLVGVEPPSIADVNNLEELQEVHRILMEGDVIILEGICNLEMVRNNLVELVALPLKIEGGDGAPVRAVIIEQSNK